MIVTQEQAWAAGAYAFRVNNESYVSVQNYGSDARPNKELALEQLLNGSPDVTDLDREVGTTARKTVTRNLTYSILADEMLTEWDRRASEIVTVESWDFVPNDTAKATRGIFWDAKYQFSIICALFKKFKQINEQSEISNRLNPGYAGEVGTRINTQVQVIVSNYSSKYLTHFITGITTNQQLVFFSYRDAVSIGKTVAVRGTVKRHTHSKEYASDLTQLSRVRITTTP